MQNMNGNARRMAEEYRIGGPHFQVAKLTELERRILAGLVDGASVKSLASVLSITPGAAQEARDALMAKLSAQTTADLVRIGLIAKVR